MTIKQTQQLGFNSRIMGSNSKTGLSFPNYKDLAKSHKINYTSISNSKNLKSKIKDCDGASIRIAKLPGEVIEEAKNLKIISRHGVGYDNIDLKKAKEKGVKIAITANANAVTVAEHVMFVLLNIAKRKDLYDKTVRDGNFKDRNKLPKMIEVWKNNCFRNG